MKLGVLVGISHETDIKNEFKKVKELGFQSCQICVWDTGIHTQSYADTIKSAVQETGVEISGLWAGWSGPAEWNFRHGPQTLGLVPKAYRFTRLKELLSASDFALMLGVTDVITHAGFIPEDPNHEDYAGIVSVLRYLADIMKKRGQYFLFETGQETPVTLLRAIEDIGTGNLGVNLDTANLIMYGKSNTVDAVDMLAKYIRNTHCKDGLFPTNGQELGVEVALGAGKADIAGVVARLKQHGYDRYLTIEREISGEQQTADIIKARDLLNSLL